MGSVGGHRCHPAVKKLNSEWLLVKRAARLLQELSAVLLVIELDYSTQESC